MEEDLKTMEVRNVRKNAGNSRKWYIIFTFHVNFRVVLKRDINCYNYVAKLSEEGFLQSNFRQKCDIFDISSNFPRFYSLIYLSLLINRWSTKNSQSDSERDYILFFFYTIYCLLINKKEINEHINTKTQVLYLIDQL